MDFMRGAASLLALALAACGGAGTTDAGPDGGAPVDARYPDATAADGPVADAPRGDAAAPGDAPRGDAATPGDAPVPDASGADATGPSPDGPGLDAAALPPDAAPDTAALPPDAAPDAAALPPDAAPDAAALPPDAAALPPDAAVPPGSAVLLAACGASLLTAELDEAAGAIWTTGTLADSTGHGPAVAMTSGTAAVGVYRAAATGELRYTLWSPGSFSAPAAVAAGVTTRAAPHMAAAPGGAVHVALHGDDYKHYFAARLSSWSPTAEPIGSPQSFGPSAPALAVAGDTTVVAFAGDDHDLYDQERVGGTWQPAHGHGLGAVVDLTPSIVIPTAGAERLVVFVRSTDAQIMYTTRTGGVWSAPQAIEVGAVTADPVALLALPAGEALLLYRGLDGRLYESWLSVASGWSVSAQAMGGRARSTPALAAGVGGMDALMAYVDDWGSVQVASVLGRSWYGPTPIGGADCTHVALATSRAW